MRGRSYPHTRVTCSLQIICTLRQIATSQSSPPLDSLLRINTVHLVGAFLRTDFLKARVAAFKPQPTLAEAVAIAVADHASPGSTDLSAADVAVAEGEFSLRAGLSGADLPVAAVVAGPAVEGEAEGREEGMPWALMLDTQAEVRSPDSEVPSKNFGACLQAGYGR